MCTACGSYDNEVCINWHEALTPEQRDAIAEGQDVFVCVVLRMDRKRITQTKIDFDVRPPGSALIGGGCVLPSGGQITICGNPEGAFDCRVEVAEKGVEVWEL